MLDGRIPMKEVRAEIAGGLELVAGVFIVPPLDLLRLGDRFTVSVEPHALPNEPGHLEGLYRLRHLPPFWPLCLLKALKGRGGET